MGAGHEAFELVKEELIRELKTEARFYRHARTGAELLSLSNEDENKVFGVAFRTPPEDSTGVAHILEHAVLCGSRKYPVKEPFVELLKGSLKTFLNAFTYPDKTCYPVASQHVQDFYNLVDVYLDAVFHPRLTPFVLRQEGWRLEADGPESPFKYKGVVFSEMKGSYSSPDSLLAEYSQHSLFPDVTYGLDSGGDPREIPRLTFEKFQDFHRKHYHPSNARFFFYGDDDPALRFGILNEYLKDFDRLEVDTSIPLQPPFGAPRRVVRSFQGGNGEEKAAKGMITVNWLLPEPTRVELNMALHCLEYILLGTPASPLRKALIESGLGEDLAGAGVESELRQMYFGTGLKGVDLSDAQRIEAFIMDTLESLMRQGIDSQMVEAAFNSIEFRLRENNTGSFPRGLALMLRSLTTWLYGGDPLALLAFEKPLEAVKDRAARGPFFEKLIEERLLNNPHRTTVVLEPEPELRKREGEREREELEKLRAAMTDGEVERILEDARKLKELQDAPDPPEALATIPVLKLADLDRENKSIPLELSQHEETPLFYHDLFTNGILYLDVGLDLHTLPQEHLPYASLLGRAFVEMGTHAQDYVSLSNRIGSKTGGIHPTGVTSSVKDAKEGAVWLFLRCKAMEERAEDLLEILKDVLLSVKLDNRERFRQMVLEEKARYERSLTPGGHQVVNLRLGAHFSEADWAAERMKGVSYLFFLRDLIRRMDEDWAAVLAVLEDMRRRLVTRGAMLLNVTVDRSAWKILEPAVASFLEALPRGTPQRASWSPEASLGNEGLILPSQVSFVGKGINLYDLGYRFHGSIMVVTRFLRNGWLWDRIRVQGGAYGAFCFFDRFSGILSFLSYRDPDISNTLEVFDGTSRYLESLDWNDLSVLHKNIIGAIGEIDAYRLPDAKGYIAMLRYLTGNTEDLRQRMREEVLGTGPEHFREVASALEHFREAALVKVMGAREAIEEFTFRRGGALEQVELL